MEDPQNGGFIKENPIKKDDDWGYPHFRNLHIRKLGGSGWFRGITCGKEMQIGPHKMGNEDEVEGRREVMGCNPIPRSY